MAKAVRFYETGGPEVLRYEDVEVGDPGPGEVRIRHVAVGLNYADTYFRNGTYPIPLPNGIGVEASGVVTALGEGVDNVALGDRVTYTGFLNTLGAYSTERLVSAAPLIRLPESIAFETAAAMTMRGLTSAYLMRRIHAFREGDSILLHAAAGGVGLLVTQLATARGARVIATVGSPEKERLAREAGAAEVIRYRELEDLTRDLPAEVRALTGGRGVHVVYDGVGRDTFDASLASLAVRGTLVLFGGSSGPVPPLDPQRLNSAGSLFLTRPTLGHYVADRDELTWRAGELFDAVTAGTLDVRVGATFPLADAADAHRALESRATTGRS
jgi:NADPH2:quinone reductase